MLQCVLDEGALGQLASVAQAWENTTLWPEERGAGQDEGYESENEGWAHF